MDKEKVTKWFDRLARATKTVYNTQECEGLGICRHFSNFNGEQYPDVHVYRGLHEAAKLLDLEVTKFEESDEYEWYGIIYKGVLFFQLDRKEG